MQREDTLVVMVATSRALTVPAPSGSPRTAAGTAHPDLKRHQVFDSRCGLLKPVANVKSGSTARALKRRERLDPLRLVRERLRLDELRVRHHDALIESLCTALADVQRVAVDVNASAPLPVVDVSGISHARRPAASWRPSRGPSSLGKSAARAASRPAVDRRPGRPRSPCRVRHVLLRTSDTASSCHPRRAAFGPSTSIPNQRHNLMLSLTFNFVIAVLLSLRLRPVAADRVHEQNPSQPSAWHSLNEPNPNAS